MIRVFLFALVLCCPPSGVFAADAFYPPPWPSADVSLTIPSGENSESHALYALFVKSFAEQTGKRLSFRYVPGQAGATAWARMADDAPDGSALTAVTFPEALLRALQPDSGVSLRNMTVCHITAYSPCVLWAPALGSLDSLRAFIDAALAVPGHLLIAGPGRYSAGQIAARVLDRQAGIKTVYIPYSESAAAAKATLNRETAAFWAYGMPIAGYGKAFRPLAVAAKQRLSSLPDVPTFAELGMDIVQGTYYGVAVPAGTPEETVTAISAFFSQHAASAAFQAEAAALGFVPLDIPHGEAAGFLEGVRTEALRLAEEYDLRDQ